MKTNAAGLKLIKQWEGLRLDAYPDPATGGEPWTIGYGHTSAAGAPKVSKGMRITEAEAEEILRRDLGQYEFAVAQAILTDMNENQFAAMVSLCFNIGPGNFKSSSVVKRFNAGDISGAAEAFLMWNKANGKVMQGLVNRREAEKKLFLTPAAAQPETPGVDLSAYVTRAELASLLRDLAAKLENPA